MEWVFRGTACGCSFVYTRFCCNSVSSLNKTKKTVSRLVCSLGIIFGPRKLVKGRKRTNITQRCIVSVVFLNTIDISFISNPPPPATCSSLLLYSTHASLFLVISVDHIFLCCVLTAGCRVLVMKASDFFWTYWRGCYTKNSKKIVVLKQGSVERSRGAAISKTTCIHIYLFVYLFIYLSLVFFVFQ